LQPDKVVVRHLT